MARIYKNVVMLFHDGGTFAHKYGSQLLKISTMTNIISNVFSAKVLSRTDGIVINKTQD